MPIQEIVANMSVFQVIIIALSAFLLCVAAIYFHELKTAYERKEEAFNPTWMDAEAFEEFEKEK